MATTSDILSIAAIVISIGSPGVAAFVAHRDRAKLRVLSEFYPNSEYGTAHIVVTALNVGRRPVILRMIGGHSTPDKWIGEHIDSEAGGKRLGESERFQQTFTIDDLFASSPTEDIVFEELWIEDSLGVRHPVPGSRDHIKRMLAP